ncbi:MAG TPA: DUF455 family protein [Candidatus Binatia bacterium]|jgi:uncharacterized ferritin-like protein (DUF455 family)|nr:DUF455 family protein [Candidatus Binatia bacterium]
MELCEFAERVLFATTLEEKLQCPAVITDERPGLPLATPGAPGRPAELRFKPRDVGKGDFQGIHRLENDRERGRLLHFFANHELLATELMALALLRFPDSPPAFRHGVLQTLKDEQEHTRLYLRRMRDCGVHFGELPLSGYFWRAISGMASPTDYVAGLSLTFEQANLDFARHFGRGFAAVGDNETARLLERIYHDEIGHVAHGLKWFRRWKNPNASDWEAFCGQLKFPLSPQRAKGFLLNVEGRRAAGFDASFIDELNVYSHSKGRTPSVFVFNPFAEGRIALGKSFTPVKHQVLLARDLANLPQFLCRKDDVVLVHQRPSVQWLSTLKQAGFALPEFVELEGQGIGASNPLVRRKIAGLRPWAWGPDSVELLEPLFRNVTDENGVAGQCFNEKRARLYSKAWSAALLRKVLSRWPAESWLCSENEVGVAAGSVEEALAAIASIRRRGHHKVVVKEAIGLAGHNALRLWEPELLEAQHRWLANALRNGGQLVVEPWLERELDFSAQFEMGTGGLKLYGYTGLLNDRKGQFQANWAAANYDRRIPASITGLFRAPADFSDRLKRLYGGICSLLEEEFRHAGFRGPAGLDAFVYRTPQGEPRLKPIVEINPRYTMGRVTAELMKQVAPGSHGLFRLVNRAMAQAEGFDDFHGYAQALTERFPLRLEGAPLLKIREGAVCLNDPGQVQVCLATFRVSRTLDVLVR